MKTRKINHPIKKVIALIFMALVMITFTSCEKKHTFLISSVIPGAKGYVTVKQDSNKNYIVEVEVSDLAEVERVNASKTTYVVWMETDEGKAENLGQLKSSTPFLSKRLTASLKTVSSFKPVKIFITTEDGINVQYPGEQVVLTTEKF